MTISQAQTQTIVWHS